jgi:hypothetical protein
MKVALSSIYFIIDSIFISSITRSIVCKILLHVVSCVKEHVQIILEQNRLVPCTNHFGTEVVSMLHCTERIYIKY